MGKYIAFISYRHTEREQELSLLLRKKLEGWHLPGGSSLPKKRKVFRDTDELPTSANLGEDIENALQDSEWLIALCSEEYVQSLWCRREITKYIEMGRKDRILPVLVSSEKETAIPEEIRDIEPVADLRGKTGRGMRAAADECAAALLGRMDRKDPGIFTASERRSRLAIRGGAIAAVWAVLLGLTFYAGRTADMTEKKNLEIAAATEEAEAARVQAVEERNRAYLANSRYIAEQAGNAMRAGDDREAIRLALSALPEDLHGDLPVSDEAISVLQMALNKPAYFDRGHYRLADSIDTDFQITGYISGFNEGNLVLLVKDYHAKQKYLHLADRGITEVAGAARTKAAEYGYSRGSVIYNSPYYDYIFYGPELPVAFHWGKDNKDITESSVSVNGEPLYADHVMGISNSYIGGLTLVWTEQPSDETKAKTAIVAAGKNEAIAVLEITGYPISADCSYMLGSANLCPYIALVDQAGDLFIFEGETGKKVDTIPGKWKNVIYPKSSQVICAIDENGDAFLIDTASHETIASFVSHSPILEIQYCANVDLYLARCADGVRIFSGEGETKEEYRTEETPAYAVWDGYDNRGWLHSGKKFLLIFDRRVDVYETETNIDSEYSDILMNSTKAFDVIYSPDSKYIYLQQDGIVTKLDAYTGKEIWKNTNTGQGITRDGEALWRLSASGLRKIDTGTGNICWESKWFEGGNYDIFTEPPDGGNIAFIINKPNGRVEAEGIIYTFDFQTGELLWTRENVGVGYWSADGKKICCIRHDEDKDADILRLWYTQLDPESGDILAEYYLPTELMYNFRYRRELVSTERDRILFSATSRRDEPYHTKIDCYSLSEGKKIQTWEMDEICDPVFSITGETAAKWTAWEDDTDYCCVLQENGGTGPVIPADSERGRQLSTTLKKNNRWESIRPMDVYEYVLFGEEKAGQKDYNFEQTGPTTITRISDGVVLLNMAYSPGEQNADVVTAPDGTSVAIMGSKGSRIIWLRDPDTLVQKARQRIEREAENK